MAQNSPREPRAELRQAAAAVHEFFIALTEQGFTEAQAMQLAVGMLASGQRPTG